MARRATVIVAAFISDRGSTYLPQCLDSFDEMVDTPLDAFTVDDSAHQLGLAGAVRQAWEWALGKNADYLFHVEEDFTFNEPLNLERLRWILELHPELAQIVLKRQAAPTNPDELRCGGIIETDPDAYIDRVNWLEHSKIFSLNPCLIPRKILELGWPDGNESDFTATCLALGYRFAIYGKRDDPPRVHHHGVRSAAWRP